MVSDRPRVLTVDAESRPHNATGPFCLWSDGTALYCWHGVRVPAKYYLRPHTAREILQEENAEVRRAMIERYDELKEERGSFMRDCGATVLDTAIQAHQQGEKEMLNELLSIDLDGDPDERMLAVRVVCPSTSREYIIRVHPQLCPMLEDGKLGKPQKLTVRNAIASTFGLRGAEYVPIQET